MICTFSRLRALLVRFFFAPFLCVVFRYACACVGVCACVRQFTVDGFNCAMMAAPCFSFLVFLFKDIFVLRLL
uniref:Uncharacterized protein n=1 Tax=Ixodes scapularis TaxID=6945 RepID=A0A4D5S5A7_IXOSC